MTAENIGKEPVFVRHSELSRVQAVDGSGASPFRSWCPVCEQGILLVGRETMTLNRVDRCIVCGQLFVYEDADIEGLEFGQTLESLRQKVKKEAWERPVWPSRRADLRAILADPVKRRDLFVEVIVATQAREGIETTEEQARAAYDKVQQEVRCREEP
jgi:hypothetical protein